jgi:hypothetical protein
MQFTQRQQLARDNAVNLFTHYFTTIAGRAGVQIDQGDMRAEIGSAVDYIIQAAWPEDRALAGGQTTDGNREGPRARATARRSRRR